MNSPTAAAPEISAQDTLSALQQAWSQASGLSPAAAPSLPLRESFLNLRDIPQISFEEAQSAFPMLAPAYPAEWKEQIRQLRNQLVSAQAELHEADESFQVIAVTNMESGRPRYGSAANLALAMASMQDMRILVVDANLLAPTLHTSLRAAAGPGLCEATRADRLTLPPCFRRVTGTQIYLLPIGDTLTFPADPLDFYGLHALLQSLRSQFDWILMDAPGFDTPAGAVAIATAADGVIVMIESERDSYREVARALGQVQGRRLLGAIMF